MQLLGTSGPFQINGLDIKSIRQSALDGLIALILVCLPLLAGATYIVGGRDITALVVLFLGLVVKTIRKWATDHSINLPPPGPLGSSPQ